MSLLKLRSGELVNRDTYRPYQPSTGIPCGCRPGTSRANCPECEGTGFRINHALIRQMPLTNHMPTPQEKPNDTIAWDKPMLERFKLAYAQCKEETFMFDGRAFYVGYAKYLIEYLEPLLK